MPTLDPVLWTKGTLLTPQHLQAQDRYLDEVLRFQLGALTFCPWGFARAAVDRAALAGGTCVITAVSGRFPDGLLFDAPASDPLPAPRPLETAWEADQRTLTVYLTVPEYRPGARNVSAGAGASNGAGTGGAAAGTARWRAEEALARDETTGLAERPIQVARPNLRLALEGEPLEGYTAMPVARLVRSAAGVVTLDPTFVPPLLDLAASETLGGTARRLAERVTAKAGSLAGGRRQRNQGLADFSVTDVASFWLLYTLNTHLPALRHLADVRRGHPSGLWEAMTALAGALQTFAPAPRPLPAYEHARPGECFAQLEARLLELLETAVPETAVALPLRTVRPAVQAVAVDQERWLSAPQWYLAVSASMRQAELVPRILQGCKVGSADVVDTLIRQALPGLELAHVPQPPPAVPVKLDFLYFALRRAGPAWDAVVRARNLAVYVPAELLDARLELVIALQ
jgi:type VI secretion system protein ImpJ